jgi:hypothetical protein
VLRAEDPLFHQYQLRQLVAGPGRIPRPLGPGGEVEADGQGVGVIQTGHSLADWSVS